MGLTGGYGAALTGVLNGLEAGGMAAQEITQTINKAYKEGRLQKTGPFQMYLDAAVQQLKAIMIQLDEDQLAEQAFDLARRQTIDDPLIMLLIQVAVVGGVIDAVQNKVLYRIIRAGFVKNAFMKGVANNPTEAVSEYTERLNKLV